MAVGHYIVFISVISSLSVLGRHFDKTGKVREWWSADSVTKFQKNAECIRNQYMDYTEEMINENVGKRRGNILNKYVQ